MFRKATSKETKQLFPKQSNINIIIQQSQPSQFLRILNISWFQDTMLMENKYISNQTQWVWEGERSGGCTIKHV
jgi:hypothetical protein